MACDFSEIALNATIVLAGTKPALQEGTDIARVLIEDQVRGLLGGR